MKKILQQQRHLFIALCLAALVSTFGYVKCSAASPPEKELPLNGDWVTHTMEADGDELWWRFEVPADGKVVLTLQSFRDATNYHLYDEEKIIRYFRTSSGGSPTTPGTVTTTSWLKKGVYHLVAADNGGNFFGGVGDVRVKAAYTDALTTESEPNDDFAHAMELAPGTTVRGVLTDIDDRIDFYRITVPVKSQINLKLVAMFSSMRVDVYSHDYVDLGKGKSVGGSETAPGTGQWAIDLDPGQYYLKITDNVYTGDPSGIYDLSWTMSPKATGISLSRTHTDLYIGQSIGLSASITPENVADKTVTWRSANSSIVRMSDDGTITGIALGETSVTATTTDGTNLTATCFVTVKEPTLSVDKTAMTLDVGQTDQIRATAEPDTDITFTSSDDTIASVTTGTVQAKKAGTCTITVSANSLTKEISVTVRQPAQNITIDHTKAAIYKGRSIVLYASVEPEDTTDSRFRWSSKDPSIATVTADGTVTGIAPGTTEITATTEDGTELSDTCTIVVKAPSLTVNKTNMTLYKGKKGSIQATTAPSAAITFRSSRPDIASVNNKGSVTAKKAGSCTITASANGLSKTVKITVKQPTLKLAKTSLTVRVKKSTKIKVTTTPSAKITYKSSDRRIATVDTAGRVIGRRKGSCKITVRANGLSKTVKITVKK